MTIEHTVELIGCGRAPAIPAKDLKPGHVRLYNYGYKGLITRTLTRGNWMHYLIEDQGTKRTFEQKQRLNTHIPVHWCQECKGPVIVGQCQHEAGKGLHFSSQASIPPTSERERITQ